MLALTEAAKHARTTGPVSTDLLSCTSKQTCLRGCRVQRGVFINYRGEDTTGYGALLYTELAHRFGEDHVFLDSESIPAGADFVEELLAGVRSSRVLLAVIGPHWLTAADPTTGRRRIDDPDDWIRRELAEAFAAGVRVIPVLIEEVELPDEDALPADIAALSRCQYRHLRRREHTATLTRIVADLTDLGMPLADGTQAPVRVGTPPMLADQFQRRNRLAARLDDGVDATGTVLLTPVLSGAGGVGKTQLAAEYATRHWPDTSLRLAMWISARSRDAVLAAYTQAAVDLLHADPAEPEQAASRLLGWLAATGQRWLIVLDDVQRPDDLLHLWPPTHQSGRTVVTTRRRDPSLVRTDRALVDVDVFTPAEAESYLDAKLADHPHLRDGAAELAADLGYLPLAMAQAVAYLTNRGLTCDQYRSRLADQRRTLRQVLPEHGELPDDHDHTVGATFTLSVDLSDTLAPIGLARPVILLASLLDPAGIPDALFTTGPVLAHLSTSLAGRPIDSDDTHDALHLLHRLNLLTVDHQVPQRAIRAHALVQRATREAAAERSPERIIATARAAADALFELWPRIEHDSALVQALRANTEALRGTAGSALCGPDTHPLLFRVGRSLGEAGLVTGARDYFDDLHTSVHDCLGPDHPDTLTVRHDRAHWRGKAGDPVGAATAFTELLADRLRISPPDDCDTTRARHDLARWRGEAGDPAGAATAFAELLTDRLRILGPDHPDTLTTRNNLIYWRGEAGDPDGIVEAFAELLTDRLRILGPDHPDTLKTRHNLARWRRELGDQTELLTS